jgi:branched-chain amino acid transport system substrate-binding protein
MKRSRLVLWLLLLVLALPSLVEGGEPIRIGALYNMTGGMFSIDMPAFNGVKLAAKQVNESGGVLGGRRIEVIGIDTRTDLQEAAEAAGKLVSMGVSACLGYGDTNFVLAAAPKFQFAKIPFITSGATDPELPARIGSGLFMIPFGDDDQASAIAEFACHSLDIRRIAVWTDKSSDFTRVLSRFFKDSFVSLGGKIITEGFFSGGDKDFSGLIARLKALNPPPGAIFASGIPDEAALIISQIRAADIGIPILSGDGFDTDLISTLTRPDVADGVYFSTHSYRGETRPEVLAFIEAYRSEYGKAPENAFAALGFDALGVVADAIRRAGSADPTAITHALNATRGFKGVTGEISYTRPSRVPVKPVSIIGLKKGKYRVMETYKPSEN